MVICCVLLFPHFVARGENQWAGVVAPIAQNEKQWVVLIENLTKNGMYYGALAAAEQMLAFFDNVETKENAYKTIVKVIDQGYPFSTSRSFVAGDIEPQTRTDFADSYYLYKAIINKDNNFKKWSDSHFEKINRDSSYKFRFYKAIEAYRASDFNTAERYMREILKSDVTLDNSMLPFIRKVARTLARVLFEQKQYEKSLEIYETFLLKLNPVTRTDWLEAAWNYYYLERYQKALGILYNMEADYPRQRINFETYIIRALVYKKLCSLEHIGDLVADFKREYGQTIDAILNGKSLNDLP
ncbi:MAG: hypothetical protein HQK54_09500, partial [Oligoflexales bacterium]|nr:hypothetical protein [Oligoflexales bacterium]